MFLFAQFAGDAVVTVFARRGTMVWQLASHGFSVFAMGFLFSGLNIFSSALFTALGNGKVSAVISFVRTFGLIITSLLILPALLGVARRVAGDPHRGAGQHLAVAVLPEAVHTGVSVRVNILRLILVLNEL